MKCPKCTQGEIKESINYKGSIFTGRKKLYVYFCPLCDFTNQKIIKISENQFQTEMENNLNTHTINYKKDKL